jgi:DnaJ family protein A protein 2
MTDGQKITLYGQGDETPQGDKSDVIILLRQKPHDTFKRIDNDLFAHVTISLAEALCGFNKCLVTHLDGRQLAVNHPAGQVIRPNHMMAIRGEGMPQHKRPFDKGDLHIQFNIEFPESNWVKDPSTYRLLETCLPIKPKQTMMEVDKVEHVTLTESVHKDGIPDEPTDSEGYETEDSDLEGGPPPCAQQ